MMRLSIVGFGLIGGSIGLGARAKRAYAEVIAIDSPEVLSLAKTLEAADTFIDRADRDQVERALGRSTLAVLAAPVQAICNSVEWVLSRAPIVTDCGSTKRKILQAAAQSSRSARFVAGHPMAGLPQGGLNSARPDLFRDRTWLLCPESADPDAVQAVLELLSVLGAQSISLSALEHDAAVARTSHLPQILASALSVLGELHAKAGAAGPAFERSTGAAGGPEPLWGDIFKTNGDQIGQAIRDLLLLLDPIADELSQGQVARALDLLQRARRTRP